MSMDHQNGVIKRLQQIIEAIKDGRVVCDEMSQDFQCVGIAQRWGSVAPSYTGHDTVTLKLRNVEVVLKHQQDIADALVPGIPVYLHDPICYK